MVGEIRAKASVLGVPLREVSIEDAAAAVVGAEMWIRGTEQESLRKVHNQGKGAAAGLSGVLVRAAGSGKNGIFYSCTADATDAMLAAVEITWEWARQYFSLDASRKILYAAASDLSSGMKDKRVASMVAALCVGATFLD